MKKILITGMLCLIAAFTFAQGIEFFQGTPKELFNKAEKENKIIFIDFHASWCGPCKMMSKEVFTLENVGSHFNENFISYKIDVDNKDFKKIVKDYKVRSLPALLFIDFKGKELNRSLGAISPEGLINASLIAKGDKKSFEQLKQENKENPDDLSVQQQMLEQAKYYVQGLEGKKQQFWFNKITKLFDTYINQKLSSNTIDKADLELVYEFHGQTDSDDVLMPELAKNYDKYKTFYSDNKLSQYLVGLNNQYLYSLANSGKDEYVSPLNKINKEYKQAYADSKMYRGKDPYTMMKLMADAYYTLIKTREQAKFTSLMDAYFEYAGKSVVLSDYLTACQTLHTTFDGHLKKETYQKCILWLAKPLAAKPDTSLLIFMSECYKELDNTVKAKECLNKAYIVAAEFKDERKTEYIRQIIQQKLNSL